MSDDSIELKKNDHKRLGKELGLFTFSDTVGKGLPLWTPKGATIRRELERFIVDEELKRGYQHVYTPDIAKLELYEKSGHYPYYKDSMYAPITIDDEKFMLRPMTCPHHFELYLSAPHSYRELPIRYAELAQLYRYEKSGELMGLLRVRTWCLADAHIICAKAQAQDEVAAVLDLIDYVCKTLGLVYEKDYYFRLSLGDRNDKKKYYKDDAAWDHAEKELREVLKKRNAKWEEGPNEAAFYGPKIDVQMKNANGKIDTAFTVQYDFVMPKRFGLTFTNEQGAQEEAVVIHRSSIGAIERTVAFLLERYEGKLPLWLSPVQVKIIPIADRHHEKAREVAKILKDAGSEHRIEVRVEIDDRAESMQAKVRETTLQNVPYLGIIGDKEAAAQAPTLAVRTRSGENLGVVRAADFALTLLKDIETKVYQTPKSTK